MGLLYAALVLFCASRHEPWFDEAQSWLIARDSSIHDLFSVYSRYEGTPALWQLLLMPFAKLGFPYQNFSFISATLAILGTGIFLWRAPFPPALRLLFPFCYFPLFQYAVVARSYALFLPLLCGIAALFPARVTRWPIFYCALLALLANASLHGALIAGVLFAEWLWTAWRTGLFQRRLSLSWGVLLVFCALYLLLLFELRLPSDIVDRSAGAHGAAAIVMRTLKQISEAFCGGLGSNLYRVVSTLTGVAVIVASLLWFRKSTAAFLFAGTLVPLLLLAGLKQAAGWHAGIIFLMWIFSLWLFAEQHPNAAENGRAMYLVIGILFVVQAYFGLRSIAFDIPYVYSGSRAAAAYLHSSGEGNRSLYAVGFKTFALQPYFDHNLFAQQEHGRRPALYSWKSTFDHEGYSDLSSQHPDLVIVGNDGSADTSELDAIHRLGYCEQRRFKGALWWKNAIAEPDTYVFMAPCR